MSLCLASYPVSTDCAALIVLLTVCLYHCRPTITGHELVLGILPCLNWLCCTNCSPHCVSVCITVRRPFLDMSLCLASYPVWTDCAALIVLLTVCLYHCRTTISGHLCLASYPVWTDCAALIVLLTVCLYHCRTTISGHELVLGILPCLNWLCCTNCSPHCVSVSLSDDHFWTWACAWHLTLFELTVLH